MAYQWVVCSVGGCSEGDAAKGLPGVFCYFVATRSTFVCGAAIPVAVVG